MNKIITSILDHNSDITIVYQGGSGGYFLYYLLLLSGQFISGEESIIESNGNTTEVWKLINDQFPLSLQNQNDVWKHTEHWQDNRLCANTKTSKRKLYLICNPLFAPKRYENNKWITSISTPVLMYTDIKTQLRLAYDKRAHWFAPDPTKVCNPSFNSLWRYMHHICKDRTIFEGKEVVSILPKIVSVFNINHTVYLQDILGGLLDEPYRHFAELWFSLHSPRARKLLIPYYLL